MKTITTTAIVALMTTTLGFSAVAPAFAQSEGLIQVAPQAGPDGNMHQRDHGPRRGEGMRGGMRGGSDLFSFERGAEAIEIALVRLSHAIALTSEQQPLFDALKTSALTAAADFSTATEALRPAAPAAGETPVLPDMSKRLEDRIAVDTARLAALKSVQPAFTAFFDSLSDEQKAQLTPQRPDRGGMFGGKFGGPRHQGGPAAPAPTDAPATTN